ncbi:hypothetical protein CEXT_624821 [Caerostris extrusa]|uniref:SWIM-type domain-containing protein n=1 Tax=Caerostris extrusa TaxID=172846 RepID=A0AAV4XY68_CAEEX|nr:hypothetical protein CEXT_624821 [Caerostris extrusa]
MSFERKLRLLDTSTCLSSPHPQRGYVNTLRPNPLPKKQKVCYRTFLEKFSNSRVAEGLWIGFNESMEEGVSVRNCPWKLIFANSDSCTCSCGGFGHSRFKCEVHHAGDMGGVNSFVL